MSKKNSYKVITYDQYGEVKSEAVKVGYESAKDLKYFRDNSADMGYSEYSDCSTTIEKIHTGE